MPVTADCGCGDYFEDDRKNCPKPKQEKVVVEEPVRIEPLIWSPAPGHQHIPRPPSAALPNPDIAVGVGAPFSPFAQPQPFGAIEPLPGYPVPGIPTMIAMPPPVYQPIGGRPPPLAFPVGPIAEGPGIGGPLGPIPMYPVPGPGTGGGGMPPQIIGQQPPPLAMPNFGGPGGPPMGPLGPPGQGGPPPLGPPPLGMPQPPQVLPPGGGGYAPPPLMPPPLGGGQPILMPPMHGGNPGTATLQNMAAQGF
jgi:hypothetical protein